MEQQHMDILVMNHRVFPERVSLLGTFDPQSDQAAVDFERCYARLRRCIRHYLDTTAEIPGTPNHAMPQAGGAIAAAASAVPPSPRRRSPPRR